jgi:hypothetical protein
MPGYFFFVVTGGGLAVPVDGETTEVDGLLPEFVFVTGGCALGVVFAPEESGFSGAGVVECAGSTAGSTAGAVVPTDTDAEAKGAWGGEA